MSAPAQLAEALARRQAAFQTFSDALDVTLCDLFASRKPLIALAAVVEEKDRTARAARANADTVANLLLSYHCIAPPPSEDLPAILSAIHQPSFSHLADAASDRILACTAFWDVAKILEDELHVSDEVFEHASLFWRPHNSRDAVDEGTGDDPRSIPPDGLHSFREFEPWPPSAFGSFIGAPK
ncbi:hypothetical protein C8R45DRAFT_1069754 [Mycena sanguinolenta]|nr:hypothetical protein C8R45DRAFT_1069754 [Mycena sanguinolenta]